MDKILTIGKLTNGLYCFSIFESGDFAYVNFCAFNFVSLWYQRLGHSSDTVLNVLKYALKLPNNKEVGICDIFHKSKQTREPFLVGDH